MMNVKQGCRSATALFDVGASKAPEAVPDVEETATNFAFLRSSGIPKILHISSN